ncbi:MAG TPA: hypothetical protein VMV18_11505, partial [bacterium]|nr:hypothetical protein [bacterium]
REIVGGTIPLVPSSAPASKVESATRAFLNTLAPLSGINDSLLRTHTLRKVGDTWFVRFDRVTANGEPVANAYAEVRITRGQVVLVRLETHPMAEAGLAPRVLAASAATAKAHDALAKWIPGASLVARGARAVVQPIPVNGAWAYRPAWEIESSNEEGGHWLSVVDGVYGEVLSRESLTRWAVAGSISGMTEPRLPGDALVSEHMAFAKPTVAGNAVVADTNGAWSSTAAAPASVTANLSGSFVHVANQGGANSSVTFSAANATGDDLTFDATNATTVEIDAYRHITEVRAWALGVTPSLAWLQQQLTVNVNLADTCNSYWDGTTVNLFSEDSTCNNTARIADVVYHEFGHGFHQNNLVSGVIDGAIGEGSGDYVSVTNTNDHLVGPRFFKNGGEVRDVEPNKVYPGDLTGEVHNDGLIWVGALWDLRKALITKYGYDAGRHATDMIFAKALSTGPTLDQAYDEVLLADDDDGNLANGTPNQCEIDAAFGLHGLNSTSSAFSMTHVEVVGPIPVSQAIPVTVTPPQTNSACAGNTVTGIDLKYTVDGGTAQTVPLTLSGSDYAGAIPAFSDEGHVVRYWFEAHLDGGNSILTPPEAPQNSYGFYVGTLFEVFKDDFDHGDRGWTHGGAHDDWTIGAPTGQGSDPTHAYSGANVFGNNLAGNYSPSADNFAESPTIDCRGCSGARLQFRRWLSVEDATYDHAIILVNGQQVYANPVGAGAGGALPKDPLWSFEDYDISAIADGHDVRIRFQLTSDQGAEYGGWNIDDVSIVTPTRPHAVPGKGCGCDLGGETPNVATLLPALLAGASIVMARARARKNQESLRR